MPSVEKICEDLEVLSGKIGDLTRTISLSVLALVWLFIAGGDNTPVLASQPNMTLLLISATFVLLSLLSDYFQFVAGYANSKEVLEVAEKTESRSAKYNDRSFLYRARSFLFWLKQIFALAALISLFAAVLSAYMCG